MTKQKMLACSKDVDGIMTGVSVGVAFLTGSVVCVDLFCLELSLSPSLHSPCLVKHRIGSFKVYMYLGDNFPCTSKPCNLFISLLLLFFPFFVFIMLDVMVIGVEIGQDWNFPFFQLDLLFVLKTLHKIKPAISFYCFLTVIADPSSQLSIFCQEEILDETDEYVNIHNR